MRISNQILVEFRDSGKAFNPLENMVDVENYDMNTQVGGLGRLIAFGLQKFPPQPDKSSCGNCAKTVHFQQ